MTLHHRTNDLLLRNLEFLPFGHLMRDELPLVVFLHFLVDLCFHLFQLVPSACFRRPSRAGVQCVVDHLMRRLADD